MAENKNNVLRGKLVQIPSVDKSLTREGMCADAKETGDRINALDRRMNNLDPHFARAVYYDNSESGLSATKVQAALDELAARVKELENEAT